MERQLPKTEEYLKRMNMIFEKFYIDYSLLEKEYKKMSDDYLILSQPMLHLANTLYNENDGWAVELAQFIAVLNGDQYINLHDLQRLKPSYTR